MNRILPTGTITFLLTDIERSTALWEAHGEDMGRAVERHENVIASATEANNGILVRSKGEGDSCFCVFKTPRDAVAAALAAQLGLVTLAADREPVIRVRMAIHTGMVELREGQYYGSVVNRCARLRGTAHGGQTVLSQATADFARDDLPPEASLIDLGSHRLPDLTQPERVHQLSHPGLPQVFPALASLDSLPNNLPVQMTRFVGRERELGEIKTLLETQRLVTLTGPGGSGKTRLSMQAAAALLESFPDGVWLVNLGAVTDVALVTAQIAGALGVGEQPGRPLMDTVTGYLRSRSTLIVLDNCEHILTGAAEAASALLGACRRVRIIATSRQALGLEGEVARPLRPLSIPSDRSDVGAEELLDFDAVQLLADRGALAREGFAITDANAAAVAQICRQLDGIPLAIEFAAGRLGSLGPTELARRLGDRFRLLGSRRSGPERHQTLDAAVDWSYELLDDDERLLFRRLAVFVGRFTLEAAEAVCADDELRLDDIADLLSRLVDRSMIFADTEAEEISYRMLAPIRSFALSRLEECGEHERMREHHLSWFMHLGEEAQPDFVGAREPHWLDVLTSAHDDARAALAWGLKSDPVSALRLAVALTPFWDTRGHWTEGRAWLEQAIAGAPEVSTHLAHAYRAIGNLSYEQGDTVTGIALLERALELNRLIGDDAGIAHVLTLLGLATASAGNAARAKTYFDEGLAFIRSRGPENATVGMLHNLGMAALARGDASARDLFEQALAISRENGYRRGIAGCLAGLGAVAQASGDTAPASASYAEALRLFREIGDKMGTAAMLSSLAVTARAQGDLMEADHLLAEALPLHRELGDRRAVATSLTRLGTVAWVRGDFESATRLYTEALGAFREIGDPGGVIGSQVALGRVARSRGDEQSASAWLMRAVDALLNAPEIRAAATCLEELAGLVLHADPERAARLFGAAEAIRSRVGGTGRRTAQDVYERDVAALGRSPVIERAWAEGRAMDAAEAVVYAGRIAVAQ